MLKRDIPFILSGKERYRECYIYFYSNLFRLIFYDEFRNEPRRMLELSQSLPVKFIANLLRKLNVQLNYTASYNIFV